MNAEKRAILISAIDELRQEVRGSWVHWINITASSDLNPDEIVDILLTACDDTTNLTASRDPVSGCSRNGGITSTGLQRGARHEICAG